MMGTKTRQLLKMLDDIAAMLDEYGQGHWARWIAEDANRLRSGDLIAISHFLDAFGGMGSLNDVTIWPRNGHSLTESEISAANVRLSKALSEAWSLARMLSGREV
jgi:hypothetical protein